MNYKKQIKPVVVLLFGIVFPVLLLFSSYFGLKSTRGFVSELDSPSVLVDTLGRIKAMKGGANDYALYSLLYLENANKTTMVNKQILKTTVVELGFAVMSIGIMLIVLGIGKNDGIEISATSEEVNFNLDVKIVSAGTAVFVAGAIMSTLAGIMKNDYKASTIPKFVHDVSLNQQHKNPSKFEIAASKHKLSIDGFKTCEQAEPLEMKEKCFYQFFLKNNEKEIK